MKTSLALIASGLALVGVAWWFPDVLTTGQSLVCFASGFAALGAGLQVAFVRSYGGFFAFMAVEAAVLLGGPFVVARWMASQSYGSASGPSLVAVAACLAVAFNLSTGLKLARRRSGPSAPDDPSAPLS